MHGCCVCGAELDDMLLLAKHVWSKKRCMFFLRIAWNDEGFFWITSPTAIGMCRNVKKWLSGKCVRKEKWKMQQHNNKWQLQHMCSAAWQMRKTTLAQCWLRNCSKTWKMQRWRVIANWMSWTLQWSTRKKCKRRECREQDKNAATREVSESSRNENIFL